MDADERWDQRHAAFDKLRLRSGFSANRGGPHAELVEARMMLDAIDRREMCAFRSASTGDRKECGKASIIRVHLRPSAANILFQ
jgi:hypothetical protein